MGDTGEAEMERLDYEVIWGYLWNGFKVHGTELHMYLQYRVQKDGSS